MSKTTGNTTFYSKSASVGSIRWAPDLPEGVLKAYVLDMAFMPAVTMKWCVIALATVGEERRLIVASMQPNIETLDCSLEADAIAQALKLPEFYIEVPAIPDHEAIERFERAVANVMHGKLEPTNKVITYWMRLVHTDGSNLFKPA